MVIPVVIRWLPAACAVNREPSLRFGRSGRSPYLSLPAADKSTREPCPACASQIDRPRSRLEFSLFLNLLHLWLNFKLIFSPRPTLGAAAHCPQAPAGATGSRVRDPQRVALPASLGIAISLTPPSVGCGGWHCFLGAVSGCAPPRWCRLPPAPCRRRAPLLVAFGDHPGLLFIL